MLNNNLFDLIYNRILKFWDRATRWSSLCINCRLMVFPFTYLSILIFFRPTFIFLGLPLRNQRPSQTNACNENLNDSAANGFLFFPMYWGCPCQKRFWLFFEYIASKEDITIEASQCLLAFLWLIYKLFKLYTSVVVFHTMFGEWQNYSLYSLSWVLAQSITTINSGWHGPTPSFLK